MLALKSFCNYRCNILILIMHEYGLGTMRYKSTALMKWYIFHLFPNFLFWEKNTSFISALIFFVKLFYVIFFLSENCFKLWKKKMCFVGKFLLFKKWKNFSTLSIKIWTFYRGIFVFIKVFHFIFKKIKNFER